MWKRLAPSRTKKLSTSWVMILRLTGKGKVAHCGLCFFYFFIMPVLEVYMEHFDEIQRIARILDIDTKFVEIEGIFVYIGDKEQKFPLSIDNLRDFLGRAHSYNFENLIFRNFKIETSNNKIIEIRNDKAIKDCKFENCEFDDFRIQSLQVENLIFSKCVFKNLKIRNCQIVNLSLTENKIAESFLLDNSENISLTNKDNKGKTSLTINYIETGSINIRGTLLQLSLSNIKTSRLNFRLCKIQSNFRINGEIGTCLMHRSEINSNSGSDNDVEDMSCEDIEIEYCIFRCNIYFPKICKKINIRKSEFEKNVYFNDVHFDEVGFYQNTFKDEVDFKTCQFEKNARFLNNAFKNNVYFNNSIFKDCVDFGECEFEKKLLFTELVLKKPLIFPKLFLRVI